MGRRVVGIVVILATAASAGCQVKQLPGLDKVGVDQSSSQGTGVGPPETGTGNPLYAIMPFSKKIKEPLNPDGAGTDPIVVPECRVMVISKQDVPSQRDGILLVLGTEVKEGEVIPPDRLLTISQAGETRKFHQLQEGDMVQGNQLLALLDDRQIRDELAIKESQVTVSKADQEAAEKTRDEAKIRSERRDRMVKSGGAASVEDADAARLTWQRYISEAVSKRAAVEVAERELHQAQTTLAMHQIRSAIPGVIKTIYKKRGEFVKSSEAVFQILDLNRLRIEGLVDVQYLPRLHLGMKVVIEPGQLKSSQQSLVGNLQAVNDVAISKDSKHPLIVSAGEDQTVRVWDRAERRERLVLAHPTPVNAVACTPPGAENNWCISGGQDGKIRLWNLMGPTDQVPREFNDQHHQAVTCLAFSPNGKSCASGGDDQEICLWNSLTGELRYRFPPGHRAGITSLQFTPKAQLISAGRDNTLRVWAVGEQGARLVKTFDSRSGDVTRPGVSPDGQSVLFDQGKTLQELSVPEGFTKGILRSPSGANSFTTFALFSPDARFILTAGSSEGRLQLWRNPSIATWPSEIGDFVPAIHATATCAAFDPSGTFLVTGSRDGQVLIWQIPDQAETDRQLIADVTLIERVVDSSTRQVRVWADVMNPENRLLAGTSVTLVIPGD